MDKLKKEQEGHLAGYAEALQDIMLCLTGENSCSKTYDPISFSDGVIHSYAFDLKGGGRHHHIREYDSVDEIKELMLNEAVDWCNDDQSNRAAKRDNVMSPAGWLKSLSIRPSTFKAIRIVADNDEYYELTDLLSYYARHVACAEGYPTVAKNATHENSNE